MKFHLLQTHLKNLSHSFPHQLTLCNLIKIFQKFHLVWDVARKVEYQMRIEITKAAKDLPNERVNHPSKAGDCN